MVTASELFAIAREESKNEPKDEFFLCSFENPNEFKFYYSRVRSALMKIMNEKIDEKVGKGMDVKSFSIDENAHGEEIFNYLLSFQIPSLSSISFLSTLQNVPITHNPNGSFYIGFPKSKPNLYMFIGDFSKILTKKGGMNSNSTTTFTIFKFTPINVTDMSGLNISTRFTVPVPQSGTQDYWKPDNRDPNKYVREQFTTKVDFNNQALIIGEVRFKDGGSTIWSTIYPKFIVELSPVDQSEVSKIPSSFNCAEFFKSPFLYTGKTVDEV